MNPPMNTVVRPIGRWADRAVVGEADMGDSRGSDSEGGTGAVREIVSKIDPQIDPQVDPQVDPMHARIIEALLFASREPVEETSLLAALPPGTNLRGLLDALQAQYAERGVNLVRVAGKWQFRTAKDLSFLLHKQAVEERKLSRAAIETLAIIAYHQPVTRAEIEDIRGVMVSKGTVDVLMEVGWVKIRGRKRTPGRPVTYGTTDAFLVQFGLETVGDLPGMDELKAAGFLDAVPPGGFTVPSPSDALSADEEPYEEDAELDLATGGADPDAE
jgi:segregation and condensation protein B